MMRACDIQYKIKHQQEFIWRLDIVAGFTGQVAVSWRSWRLTAVFILYLANKLMQTCCVSAKNRTRMTPPASSIASRPRSHVL